jgi:hypothetical protein
VIGVHADTKTHAQNAFFTRGQRRQHAGRGFAQVGLDRGIDRQERVFVFDEIAELMLSSSSPIGVSSETGSLAIFSTLRTLSSGICETLRQFFRRRLAADFVHHLATVRTSLLMVSIICTGIRMVRA